MPKQQGKWRNQEHKGPEAPSLLRVLEAVRKSTGITRPITKIEKVEHRLATAKKIADSGRLAAPKAKVPVAIMKGMQAKMKKREARAEKDGRSVQVALIREQKGESAERRDEARAMVARNFAGDRSGLLSGRRGIAPSVGHFKDGALHLSARDAARLNHTGRGRGRGRGGGGGGGGGRGRGGGGKR